MRMSTASLNETSLRVMLEQQAQLNRTQNEVASGKRVQTPSDDPAAATAIAGLRRSIIESGQFASNANLLVSRLSFSEQALAAAGGTLQRLQELAVQANSGALDEATRASLAEEIRGLGSELLETANRRDASGEYLFSGLRTQLQPFSRSPLGAAIYQGDTGTRAVQVSSTQRIADGHSGFEVFVDLRPGNGDFVTGAAPGNTGAGRIDIGNVLTPSVWTQGAGSYSITFPTVGTYEVRDAANALVSSGTYESGLPIQFAGVQVTISGQIDTADRFTVDRASRQSIFESIDRLLATIEGPASSSAERARFATSMERVINDLARSNDHLLGIRAQLGSRLSTIDNGNTAREDARVELERTLSELQDVDYAEAISRMNLQLVGLQAAQQSYTRIAQLSLFNFL